MKLLKDIHDDIEAKNALLSIEDASELRAFIKGERREGLLDLAAFRLNLLKGPVQEKPKPQPEPPVQEKPKQGEQTEPFTQPAADFKGPGVEGTKAPKTHTTIEDVLEARRKAGREV